MPSFISHTVMAKEVYNKIDKKKVDLDYMLTYSLGGDLCKYAKCRYDSHHIKKDEFIKNMIDYIKENKLTDNKKIMGVLYGHICHYIMDDTMHPLIKKIDKACIKNKRNHALIEEYADSFLTIKQMHLHTHKYLGNKVVNSRVDKDIAKMLNYVYMETYNTKGIAKYYRFNLWLYRRLSGLYRILGDKLIGRISGLKRFISKNNQILVKENDQLLNTYDKCVEKAISKINRLKI